MPTFANAWELDGKEISHLGEFGAAQENQLDGDGGVRREGRGRECVTDYRAGEENRLKGEFVGSKPVERGW